MKQCSKCKLVKAYDEFQKDNSKLDGYRYSCKSCTKKMRDVHRDKANAKYREYYANNRARMIAKSKRWNYVNRERLADRDFNKHARLRLLDPSLFVEFIHKAIVFERDDYTCKICLQPLDTSLTSADCHSDKYPVMDHIWPLAKGGEHSYANVQAVHKACNDSKSAKLPTGEVANEVQRISKL